MKKNIFKFFLDLGLMVLLVLMYNKRVFNMTFHELGGLILFGVILVHLIINYRWIVTVTKRLFSKTIPVRTRLGYLLNILLLITFILIIISGIMISKTLFHLNIRGGSWKTIHYSASAVALLLTGLHLGLHKQFIFNTLKKIIPLPRKISRVIGIVFTLLITIFGCYSMVTTSFSRWLSMPFTSAQMQDGFEHGEFGNQSGRLGNFETPGELPEGEIPQGNAPQGDIKEGDQRGNVQKGTAPEGDSSNSTAPDKQRPDTTNADQISSSKIKDNVVVSDKANNKGGNKNDFPQRDGMPSRKDFSNREGFPEGNGQTGVSIILLTIAQFFSISYVFAVITALIDMLIMKRKKGRLHVTENMHDCNNMLESSDIHNSSYCLPDKASSATEHEDK